jgi:hypothetical protein
MSYIAKLGQEFGQYVTQLTGQLLLSNQHPNYNPYNSRAFSRKIILARSLATS